MKELLVVCALLAVAYWLYKAALVEGYKKGKREGSRKAYKKGKREGSRKGYGVGLARGKRSGGSKGPSGCMVLVLLGIVLTTTSAAVAYLFS